MTDTTNLGLPLIDAAQAQKHVTHNEALGVLDALVQLSVLSRALTAPPSTPAEGDRYIVKATGTGAFAGKNNQVAQFSGGGWLFYAPRIGWLAYVADEGLLVAWDGSAWSSAATSSPASLQNLTLLGIGTTADSTNPLSAKLNNALWVAKTVSEGGDGNLRCKLSKESAAKTLSILYQDNFSGRAEIGLTGDDDFHFKVSPDGSAWIDALLLDKTTGSAKINAGFFLTGDISPAQITADQNDYNPTGLSSASILRLTSDASRNITGLSGGGDGRVVGIVNTGMNAVVLKDANASSSAANRFAFGADMTLAAAQSALLWYDSTETRWKLLAAWYSGGGAVTSVGLALPGIFAVTGSPVTGSGTLTGTLATQNANAVWAGPASGAAASPSFRALIGADLPTPASSALGGVQAKAAVTSNWLRSLGTDGVLTASQPAFSDISGTAGVTQGGTGATTASAARTNLGLGTAATQDTGISANNIPKFYTGGNLGIGTSTPAQKFTVSDSNTWSTLYGSAVITDAGAIGAGFTLDEIASSGRAYSLLSTGGSAAVGAGKLAFFDTTASIYRMVIDSSGKVGIGDSSPSDLLTVGGNAVPTADNSYTCGKSGQRWSAVWSASGTIQTSDANAKTKIQPSDLGLDFILALNPVSYQWIVGANLEQIETEDFQVEVQATETVKEKVVTRRQQDGKLVETSEPQSIQRPLFDELPVVDANGKPVLLDGQPKTMSVPRMISVTRQRPKKTYLAKPGDRRHYGLIAQQVKQVLGDADFGGWVLTNTDDPASEQGLRYDQFIAPLIKAVQELSAKVAALEAQQP